MSDQERMTELIARMKLRYPLGEQEMGRAVQGVVAASGGRADTSGTDSSSTAASPPPRGGPRYRSRRPEPEDMSSIDDSFATDKDPSLQHALEQAREQIRRLQIREHEIATLSLQTQQQLTSVQEQVGNMKTSIRAQLASPITEDEYQRIDRMPESQRDITETLKHVIFQQKGKLHLSHDEAWRRVEELEERLKQTDGTLRQAQRELVDAQKVGKHELDEAVDRSQMYERRVKTLEEALRDALQNVEINATKVAKYDKVHHDLVKCEAAKQDLEERCAAQAARLRAVEEEVQHAKDELLREKGLIQGATTEAKFASKECVVLNQRVKDLEFTNHRLEAANEDLQQQRTKALDQLNTERESLRSQYEAKFKEETDRLKKNTEEDLQRVRQAAAEMADREGRSLREARDEALRELTRVRCELENVRDSSATSAGEDKLRVESLQQEAFELRMQLNVRANELLRTELMLRESEANQERSKGFAQCLERKLDMLKSEFYDLRLQHTQRVGELELALQAHQEKAKALEDMEAEAEVFLGTLAEGGNELPTALAIPASRRATHSINIAKRSLHLENQLTIARREVAQRQQEVQSLSRDLEAARAALNNSNNPFGILTDGLKAKDAALASLREEYASATSENNSLREKNKKLTNDINVLLRHRAELQNIRDALMKQGQLPQAAPAAAAVPRLTAAPEVSSATKKMIVSAGSGENAVESSAPPRVQQVSYMSSQDLFASQPMPAMDFDGFTVHAPVVDPCM